MELPAPLPQSVIPPAPNEPSTVLAVLPPLVLAVRLRTEAGQVRDPSSLHFSVDFTTSTLVAANELVIPSAAGIALRYLYSSLALLEAAVW
jgi:hypothetical protein